MKKYKTMAAFAIGAAFVFPGALGKLPWQSPVAADTVRAEADRAAEQREEQAGEQRSALANAKAVLAAHNLTVATKVQADGKKPNILCIWGDDIGTWNISHNNRGMMGYKTPNIDRIAREGVAFTDYYAQQSCTAGRAAFISGSVPVRSGMTKVGMPARRKAGRRPT